MAQKERMGSLLSKKVTASKKPHKQLLGGLYENSEETNLNRAKAYNVVQVFHFLSETLEGYYCRKLLSISNNRLDTYIALRFQGSHAHKIAKESIIETENKNVFTVKSKTERGVFYTVDMTVGVCTCP